MNVEISRNELAGALNALGKLVSRTNQADVYRSLRIEGKNDIVFFRTVGSDEAITYAVPAEGVEEFACHRELRQLPDGRAVQQNQEHRLDL